MKYNITVVTPDNYTHHRAFDEIVIGLKSGLTELGVYGEGGKTIILGANTQPNAIYPDNCVIYNLEQMSIGSPWMNNAYINLLGRYEIWDYSHQNIAELKKVGIEAKYCGIGYAPELTKIPKVNEDIDVVFYGSINDRRKKILDELAKYCSIGIAIGYGEQRDKTIARGKIILNMHYYESKIFEMVRCSYLMANKKLILSENSEDKELELNLSVAVTWSAYTKLVDVCLDLLDWLKVNPETLRVMEENGFKVFSKMKQSDYLKAVI